MVGLARAYEGELVNSDDANEHISVHRLPVGVSVGICPWNFPVFVMARKLAPALLTGGAPGGGASSTRVEELVHMRRASIRPVILDTRREAVVS